MKEEACVFGAARSLVGVITDPPPEKSADPGIGVVILNSGIVHRVGLNRLHVKMARKLAELGFVVLRFDFSGIGDSGVREDSLPFLRSAVSETREAMDYLTGARSIERFVLVGICSGAGIAFKTACADARAIGVVPINRRYFHGTDESAVSLRNRALARHYWRIAFSSSFQAKNWRKALTGRVNYRSLLTAMGSQLRGCLSFRNRRRIFNENPFLSELYALTGSGVRVLLVHCEGDEGLDHLLAILGPKGTKRIDSGLCQVEIISGANHTFTLLWSQDYLLRRVESWLLSCPLRGKP